MRIELPRRHSPTLVVFTLHGTKKPGRNVCRRKGARAVTVLLLILVVGLGFAFENFSFAKQPPRVSPSLRVPSLVLETEPVSKRPSTRVDQPVECYVSTTTWQNDSFATQTTPFVAQFDMTPNTANMDGVTSLSLDPALYYDDAAAIVRFNVTGFMDAIDNDNYRADTVIPYSPGVTYHFRLLVYPASHVYTIMSPLRARQRRYSAPIFASAAIKAAHPV